MEYYYIPNTDLSEDKESSLEQEGAYKRSRRPETEGTATNKAIGIAGAGAVGADITKNEVHRGLHDALTGEFAEIRNDPELRQREMDNLIKVYNNFVNKTGNKVEYFLDNPGTNYWAAGTTSSGEDVVYWDSSAPHAAVMAHELGHIDMNHSTDPLALLQRTGIGRFSGGNAEMIGAGGALLGALAGRMRNNNLKNQIIGSAIGGTLGTVGGSGQFAYELGGASGRAMDYLPEEMDSADAYGDLFRAGMTYGMAGPASAAASAIGATALGAAIAHPRTRKFAGEVFNRA